MAIEGALPGRKEGSMGRPTSTAAITRQKMSFFRVLDFLGAGL